MATNLTFDGHPVTQIAKGKGRTLKVAVVQYGPEQFRVWVQSEHYEHGRDVKRWFVKGSSTKCVDEKTANKLFNASKAQEVR